MTELYCPACGEISDLEFQSLRRDSSDGRLMAAVEGER